MRWMALNWKACNASKISECRLRRALNSPSNANFSFNTLERYRWVRTDPRLIYLLNIPLYFPKYDETAAGGHSWASADDEREERRRASPSLTILPVRQLQWGRADPRNPSMSRTFSSWLLKEHFLLSTCYITWMGIYGLIWGIYIYINKKNMTMIHSSPWYQSEFIEYR